MITLTKPTAFFLFHTLDGVTISLAASSQTVALLKAVVPVVSSEVHASPYGLLIADVRLLENRDY